MKVHHWSSMIVVAVLVACGSPARHPPPTCDAGCVTEPVDSGSPDAATPHTEPTDGGGFVDGSEQLGIGPTVDNLQDGATVRHPWVLVEGTADAGEVQVRVGEHTQTWPVRAGRFKAILPLTRGMTLSAVDHLATLRAGDVVTYLSLRYVPQTNPRFLRFIYMLSADGPDRFDAPGGEPNDTQSAVERIAVAARLLQTLTAEAMHDQGFGRRTFRVEEEEDGDVKVHVIRSSLTTAQAHAMTANQLWSHFYGELGSLPQRNDSIDVLFMGMTHYDAATQKILAHGALGGGRLAMFGTGALHTWAPSLSQLVTRLGDDRLIDTTQFFDDSAGRGTNWANFSTGLGATLHEIGHTLSLPHPEDRVGIMSRGFDHVNRTLMMYEPASKQGPGIDPMTAERTVGFGRSDTVRLAYHRFLSMDDPPYAVHSKPTMTKTANDVTIASPAGLRHLLFIVDGRGGNHREYLDEAPKQIVVTIDELRTLYPAATSARLTVIDGDGNIQEGDVSLQ